MELLREFIRQELQERRALGALAMAAALGASDPSFATTVDEPGTHVAHVDRKDVKHPVTRAQIDAIVQRASQQHGVDPDLVHAVIEAESNYKPNARSGVGAQGLMQLMPKTAEWLGVDDPWDPEKNVMGGTMYLKKLLRMFDGDVRLAVAAYNAGPTRVRKLGDVPPFEETQGYVKKVLANLEKRR